MPSPFPGMDPYIEDPEIWSDFHGDLAAEIRAELNRKIQPRYVARLTPRVTYEEVEVAQTRVARPDVGVWKPRSPETLGSRTAQAVAPSPVESAVPMELPLHLYSVMIHETGTMQLVTSIEILSPVNKRPGHEAHAGYLRKRRELLRSDVHLIEIDLLRGGERPPLEKPVPRASYYITLSRKERRPVAEVWPIQLADELPALPVPLLEPDPDAALDLGSIVRAVYERGAYARQIDYSRQPPPPPLEPGEAEWARARVRS
jgi:hypothetical protein